MHCMIAWGSADAQNPLSVEEHEAMELTLSSYQPVRAFPGAFVINVADEAQRLVCRDQLAAASRELDARVHVLISPLIADGTGFYSGFLASTLWEQLNKKVV